MEMYELMDKMTKYGEHIPGKNYVLFIAFDQDTPDKSIKNYWVSNNMTIEEYRDYLINSAMFDGYIRNIVACDYPLNTTTKPHFENDLEILFSDVLDVDPVNTINIRDAIYEQINKDAVETYQYFARFQGQYTRKIDFELLYDRNERVCSKYNGKEIIENYTKEFFLQAKTSWFYISQRLLTNESTRLNNILSHKMDWADHALCHLGDPFFSDHGISVDMVEKFMSYECEILSYKMDGDIEALTETTNEFEKFKKELTHVVLNHLLAYAVKRNDVGKMDYVKSLGFTPTKEDIHSWKKIVRLSSQNIDVMNSIFNIKPEISSLIDQVDNNKQKDSMTKSHSNHNNEIHL